VRTESYIALLRAVNLGPHNKIAMADLRDLVAGIGFADPQTHLNSGNVVFHGAVRPSSAVERQLEAAAKERLKLETVVIVRTAPEWARLVARNPFQTEAAQDPGHLLAVVLKDSVTPARVNALRSAIAGRERLGAEGRHVYAVYPDGVGRSKLTMALIEKQLGVRATARNWNTVLRLKELVCG
jgi:uncharacterized protein (DUF1697 family)